jgi:hypothetical protein
MSKVFSAEAVSVDGSISARTPGGVEEAVPAPGVTHLRYGVVR